MFGKLSIWISASVLATTLAFGGSAEASVRKTNMLSNVRTQIIPNWNNTGADVCVVHNFNPVAVSVIVSVFPTGTLVLAGDRWTFPMVLGAGDAARVYSWTPLLPPSEYCKLMVVR
jgi:hypothetical protein